MKYHHYAVHPDEGVESSASFRSAGGVTSPSLAGESVVVALLGDVATRRNGGELVPLPGTRSRILLVALAGNIGRSRSAQALIDEVWADQPPRSPMNALHTQMSRLRAALPEGAIEMSPAGYRLTLAKPQVDLALARLLEQRAQQLHAEGAHRHSLDLVDAARALWRGEPGADLPGSELSRELAVTAAARQAALDVVEASARVALGDLDGALTPARAAAARDPVDEAAHRALMHILVGLGRTNEALEVFAAIRSQLADQLGADPGPALVELNTAILRGEAVGPTRAPDQQPEPMAEPAPHARKAIGLRAAPNPLLGRSEDLAALDDLLHAARVTTVLGPGGTGKTRVANELGARWAGRLPVALVELASLRSGDEVVAAISSVLGLSEVERVKPGGIASTRILSPMQRLRDALGARPQLLILDNCEHVIDTVAEVVAELVGSCDQLTVLSTSRSPLMITAESVYPLSPLQIDEHGSPATELFMSRARAVRPSARLAPDEVARLCRTLDGLPLAIELAAARVRSMSVAEINAGLDSRFALLRGGDRTSPERHRTLHAVIDWSWNLLDVAQQAALRRLCRFPAGFTLSAARAVAGWDAAKNIEDALEGLVNQSLLAVIEAPQLSGTRYRMLETVREFGEEQLALADEEGPVMQRMASWAEEFVHDLWATFLAGEQIDAVLSADIEQDNLLAVLRHATARLYPPPGAAVDEAGFRTARRVVFAIFASLGALWSLKGQHSEVTAWSPKILDIEPPDPDEAEFAFDSVAAALVLAAVHCGFNADIRATMVSRMWLRGLLRARSDGTPHLRFTAMMLCQTINGRGMARQLAIGIRSGDRRTRVCALSGRANLRENDGDIRGSMQDALRALPMAEADHDVHSIAMICQHLGSVYGQVARYQESVAYYRRAVDGLTALHAFEESAQNRGYLVCSLVGDGRLAEARREIDAVLGGASRAVTTTTSDSTNRGYATIMAAAAELALAEGKIEEGLEDYRQALVLSDWPESEQAQGPFSLLLASAAVCAHALHGRTEPMEQVVAEIAELTVARFDRYVDLPQIGAVAVAIVAHRLALGSRDEGLLELLALAPRVTARQDRPSQTLDRHLRSAMAVFGDERVELALAGTAGMPRKEALAAILSRLGKKT